MSLNVGSLHGSLTLVVNGFMDNLAKATTATQQAASQMQKSFNSDGPQRAIENTDKALQKLQKNANFASKDMKRIVTGILVSQAFYKLANAIETTVKSVVTFTNEMRAAAISFEYFLGSKERAEAFMEVMKDFAAVTPYSTVQAFTSARKLMAMGFRPEEIKSVMGIMMDAAAATGATEDQIQRVVLALGQMKTNGRVAGQELRQLAETGIPVYKILQEELGLTTDQLREIGDLKIDGDLGVAAVLTGLEKRYKGAAARIAETVPGMWSTIKDDFAMITEKMFEGPYNSMERFLRRIRDSFERAREVLTEKGVGTWLENIFPPSVVQSFRAIIAAFISLGQSIAMVFKTLQPFIAMAGTVLVNILGILLPLLAGIVRIIANLARIILSANPVIRMLAQGLISLLVANMAAQAMLFLMGVMKMSALVAIMTQAVNMLRVAIQALYLTMTKNPIVGIISLIAAALLSLALSSKVVSQWLDNLMAKLAGLAGVDTGGILAIGKDDKLTEAMDAYNQKMKEMGDKLKDVGKNAGKAGKDVKDKFVASFDELYQIPDKLDDIGSGFEDIIEFPEMPVLDVTPISVTPPKIDTSGLGDLDEKRDDIPGGSLPQGPMPPPLPSPIETAMQAAMVIAKIVEYRESVKREFDHVMTAVRQVSDVFVTMGNVITNVGGVLIPEAMEKLRGSFAPVLEPVIAMRDGIAESFENIKLRADALGLAFDTTLSAIQTSISNWSFNTALSFGTWILNTSLTFTTWAESTAGLFGTWILDTSLGFAQWFANIDVNLGEWLVNQLANFALWSLKTGTLVKSWIVITSGQFSTWFSNTGVNLQNWVNNGIKNVGIWATNTSTTIGNWVNGTAASVATWVNNVAGNFAAWGNGVSSAISTWASNSWGTFKNWLTGTATGVSNWAHSTIGTIVSWAQSAWSTIKSLAKAVGMEVGNWAGSAGAAISSAAVSVGEWAGDNKEWLIPLAVTAAVVGAGIALIGSGGAAAPALLPLLALEHGGFVDQEQLVRMGEKGRREVTIPLENELYMRPFAQAVSNNLAGMMGNQGNSSNDTRPIFYVGTMIADERSLRELERKMEFIRMEEGQRRGEQ